MRAHLLTFILILISSECPLLIAGEDGPCKSPPAQLPHTKLVDPDKMGNKFRMECIDGYVRKAGTSSLFKCINNSWTNNGKLRCIPDPKSSIKPQTVTTAKAQTHTTRTTTTPSQASTSAKTAYVTTGAGKSTPTTSTATTRTSNHTTLRKEETKTASVSTTTRSSLTDTQYTTSESSSSPQTSTTTATLAEDPSQSATKHASNQAISIGIVLVIVLGLAATAALLLWRRRSRRQMDASYAAEMMLQSPISGQPLLESSKGMSSPAPESSQHLKAPTTVCTCAALAP